MTSLSKTSQDILIDNHFPLEAVDECEASSDHEDFSEDKESSSNNASESNSRSGSSRTGNTDEDINLIKDGLARQETKNVFRLRLLVILILVATGIAMSFTIYHITHQAEIDKFHSDFEAVADTIIASLNGTYEDGGRGGFLMIDSLSIMRCLMYFRMGSRQMSCNACLQWPASP